jgi:hypothetical protein
LKVNFTGCALCNSTWGDYFKIIEETNLFFCCSICAELYDEIIKTLKTKFELTKIDNLHLQGNSKKRKFVLVTGDDKFSGEISFFNEKIIDFDFHDFEVNKID